MKCTYCGAFIPNNVSICPRCRKDQVKQGPSRGVVRSPEDEIRRRQIIRRKRAKQRRQRLLLMLFLILVLIGAGSFLLYRNSYAGVVRRGQQALGASNLAEAEVLFRRSIRQNPSRAEGYAGLAGVFIKQDDLSGAESIFLLALQTQTTNIDLYRALIHFYLETNQVWSIPLLLQGVDEQVIEGVSDYFTPIPEFTLSEGTFQEVQEIALTIEGEMTIRYTTDGTEPTLSSTVYTEPILLREEGTTTIRAIGINEQGIPSLVNYRTFTIAIPIAGAPAVSPPTGQYNRPTQIVIQVPDGYTAFFTMDGSIPTINSTMYEYPIDMPEGQTVFSAILVSGGGRVSEVTQRNYILELGGEESSEETE